MAETTVTKAEVLALADGNFMAFKAAAKKLLSDVPDTKDGILAALNALPDTSDASQPPTTDPLDHDGNGKKGGTRKLIRLKLNRSHWIGEVRHDPPQEIDVDLEEALRLVGNGVASRTDPLA